MEPVVVSASRIPAPAARTAAAATVITRKDIERTNPASPVDLLRSVPGLHIDQAGGRGGVSSIYLRNADPNFTTVLIDGVKVNDPTNSRGGSFDISTLSVDAVERVEVVRGPLSAVHGGDALAGVVNVVTRRGTDEPQLSVTPEIGGDDFHRLGLGLSGSAGGAYMALTGSRIHDERAPGGAFDADHGTARVDVGLTPAATVQLASRFVDAESESFPDDSGGPRFAARRDLDQRDSQEFSLSLELSHEITERLGYRLAGTWFARDEDFSSPGVAPGVRDPFGIPPNATDSRFRRGGLAFGATATPAAWLRITAGADFQHEDGESDSVVELGGVPVPGEFDLSRSVVGTYVEGRVDTPLGLSVNGGVRLDLPEDFDDEVSGRAGVVYRVPGSGTTLKVSWSEGFKLPSFFALGNPVVGNPDLGPETSESIEVGLRQEFAAERVALEATYFHSRYFDLVDLDEGPPPALVNRSEVTIEGVELALTGAVTSRLSARGHLTYASSDIEGTSEPLRNRPEWRGGLALAWAPISSVSASLTGLYVGRVPDSSIPTGDATLDPYVRFDAALSYRPDPSLTITFAVDNLFDAQYEEAVGFPAAGVTPRIGVRAVF